MSGLALKADLKFRDKIMKPSKTLFLKILLIAAAMLITMTAYEIIKQRLHPQIDIWTSHIITILFSTFFAITASFFILRRQERINRELILKNTESEMLRKKLEENLRQLKDAFSEIKTLSGLLPICAVCKKIRDDSGYWHQIEQYIRTHSDADFSHSVCPDCARKLYPELSDDS